MHETPGETLSAPDDLIDEIDDWLIEHDGYYFDPISEEVLLNTVTRLSTL